MPRPHFALLAAAMCLSLAGCADNYLRAPAPETPKISATFTAEFSRTATGLRWAYRIRNAEGAPLVLFNGPDADHPDDPAPVWVTRRDDDTAEVAQRLLGPPEGVDLTRPMVLHGTLVPAGQEVTGTATVRLPLTAHHPYAGAFDPPLERPDGAEEVVFCLGVARESEFVPIPTASPAPAAATAGPLYAHLSGSERRQHLFCSASATLPG
jgi:hypothetical protein